MTPPQTTFCRVIFLPPLPGRYDFVHEFARELSSNLTDLPDLVMMDVLGIDVAAEEPGSRTLYEQARCLFAHWHVGSFQTAIILTGTCIAGEVFSAAEWFVINYSNC